MATRFRLTNDTTAPAVSPALETYSHNAPTTVRRKLLTSDSSALTTTAYTPDGADHIAAGDALWCQFVSDPMMAGRTFSNGAAISLAMQGLEAHANNNLNIQLFVEIVSQDGNTSRRVLRAKVEHATELGTSLSSFLLSTTQGGADYTTVAGDRLLIEIAVEGTPAATGGVQGHNGSMRFGGNGAGGDITADGQTGTTLNPWFEVAPNDLFFDVISGSATANAVIKKTISGSFTADAVIKATPAGSATADAVIKATPTVTFVSDAVIEGDEEEFPTWVSPLDNAAIDSQPVLVFTMPNLAAAEMWFQIQLDRVDSFDGPNFRSYKLYESNTGWEYWNNSAWVAMPTTGVDMAYAGNEGRFTPPSALANGTWYRRIRAGRR